MSDVNRFMCIKVLHEDGEHATPAHVRVVAEIDYDALAAENAALRDLSFPPFGHEFTVPTDKMDAEFLSWIRRNCLIVTEDHYTALRSRVADLEKALNGVEPHVAGLQARLAEAEAHIESLCRLVEWWAPKDGTPRTADARAHLARKPCTHEWETVSSLWDVCRLCGAKQPSGV